LGEAALTICGGLLLMVTGLRLSERATAARVVLAVLAGAGSCTAFVTVLDP